jgi:hypothetical protein
MIAVPAVLFFSYLLFITIGDNKNKLYFLLFLLAACAFIVRVNTIINTPSGLLNAQQAAVLKVIIDNTNLRPQDVEKYLDYITNYSGSYEYGVVVYEVYHNDFDKAVEGARRYFERLSPNEKPWCEASLKKLL